MSFSFSDYFSHSTDLHAILDGSWNFVEINRAWESELGWKPVDLLGRSLLSFVLEGDLNKFTKEKQRHQFECHLKHQNSDPFQFSCHIHFGNGHYYISARPSLLKIIQKEKLEMEDRLQAVLSVHKIGIWDWNLVENSLVWDKSMFHLFGVTDTESTDLTKLWNDAIHPHDALQVKTDLQMAISGNSQFQSDFRIIRPDGTQYWLRAAALTFNDETGTPARIVGCTWDITKERETQIVLMNSSKLATLGQMASGIAHEINNPLAIILAKTLQIERNTLRAEYTRDDLVNDLHKINSMTERISKIIKGLRAFSRDSEHETHQPVTVDHLLSETLDLCASRFKSNSIDLRILKSDGLRFHGRPMQISQILMNLLGNAFDAVRDQNEKWIELSATQIDERIVFKVRDSGRGIPEDIRNKIMLPFFTTKPEGQGTGLGLSISLGIAAHHHGKLYLDATDAHTCFVLELPTKPALTKAA